MRILGKKGGKGGGGGGSHFREDPNNLKSISTAKVLDLVSEGEIYGLVDGLKSIYLDGVAMQNADGSSNFNGVSVEMRNGTPDQDYLSGFSQVETFLGVNAEVKHDFPIMKSFTDENADAVVVTMSLPSLSKTDTSSGSLLANSVHFSVEIRADGGTWHNSGDIGIYGKCVSEFQRSYYFRLPSSSTGVYDIRVTRISADADTGTVQNSLRWFGFTKIIESKLNYANRAICGLTVRADQFGSNVPNRAYEIYGLIVKVPSNYDAWNHRYTSEIWDGTFKRSWTNNPAWVFYDLLTNGRYGLGREIMPEYIDKYGLYMIGRYCDELVDDGRGGKEPRFTFNGCINSRESAYSVLNNLAGAFNSMIYYSGTSIVLVQDSPKTPVRDFTPSNVLQGQFNYEGVARSARHSIFQVAWSNPELAYEADIESVENPDMIQDIGWKTNEITLLGCTSRGQARRRALRDVYTEQHETETVTFSVSVENADIAPGDIIRISDPSYAGYRYGGRIKAVDPEANTITFDESIDFSNGTSWQVGLILPDNTWFEATATPSALNSDTVHIDVTLPKFPEIGSVWSLKSDFIEPRLFRVLSIKEDKPYQYVISALLHYNQKYDIIEKGAEFVEGEFSKFPTGVIKAPINLFAEQSLFASGSSVTTSIELAWENADPRATLFLVQYTRKSVGVWIDLSYTSSENAIISNNVEDTYQIRVQAIDALGRKSAWTEISFDAPGFNLPAENLATLSYTLDKKLGIFFTWTAATAVDFKNYVLNLPPYSDIPVELLEPKYHLRPYNFTGVLNANVQTKNLGDNLSKIPAECGIQIESPVAPEEIHTVFYSDGVHLNWDVPVSTWEVSHYLVHDNYLATTSTALTPEFIVKPRHFGDYFFQIQTVDVFDNISKTKTYRVFIERPANPQPSIAIENGVARISWASVHSAFPIKTYQVFSVTGQLLQETDSTFYDINGPSGVTTYRIRAVDIAGNSSDFSEISVDITDPSAPEVLVALNKNRDGLEITWTKPFSILPIVSYDVIRQWGDSQEWDYGTTDSTVLLVPPIAAGDYTFMVRAVDASGNHSVWGTYNLNVRASGAAFITDVNVIDNNVQVYWQEPTDQFFAIAYYNFGTLEDGYFTLIGRIDARFASRFEREAGQYTYQICPVDVAGNVGICSNITAQVAQPPDFIFFDDKDSTFNGTLDNAVLDGKGGMVLPVYPDDTWQDNINRISALLQTTPEAVTWTLKVDNDMPNWMSPPSERGIYTEIVNAGAMVPSTSITVSVTSEPIEGNPQISCKIDISEDGVVWREAADGSFFTYASSFQFVRYTFTVTGGMTRISSINYRLDVKKKSDFGAVHSLASDNGEGYIDEDQTPDLVGTYVPFLVDFTDVQSGPIAFCNEKGKTAYVSFQDVYHPKGFRVYVLDTNGRRVDGQVSWSAHGV